jgi:hypothetical protein
MTHLTFVSVSSCSWFPPGTRDHSRAFGAIGGSRTPIPCRARLLGPPCMPVPPRWRFMSRSRSLRMDSNHHATAYEAVRPTWNAANVSSGRGCRPLVTSFKGSLPGCRSPECAREDSNLRCPDLEAGDSAAGLRAHDGGTRRTRTSVPCDTALFSRQARHLGRFTLRGGSNRNRTPPLVAGHRFSGPAADHSAGCLHGSGRRESNSRGVLIRPASGTATTTGWSEAVESNHSGSARRAGDRASDLASVESEVRGSNSPAALCESVAVTRRRTSGGGWLGLKESNLRRAGQSRAVDHRSPSGSGGTRTRTASGKSRAC